MTTKTVKISPNQVRNLIEIKSKMEAAQSAYLTALKVVFADVMDVEKDRVVAVSIDGIATIEMNAASNVRGASARLDYLSPNFN